MGALDLARWQFGITTVYHFFFVPLTIGLAFVVAGLQTTWVVTGDDRFLKATKFFGKLFLINFAMGVVTGIVQEFQFGMNWSDYSRFVGDIFGAPLAVEALLAFFLESTFLGLWIFGWDRLPKRLHLATIWAAAIGTGLSAYMILAANAFMQHPVGYSYNPATNRAELNDFGAVLFQNTAVVAWAHTMAASFLTAGAFVAGVSAWLLMRGRAIEVMRATLRVGAVLALVAGIAVVVTGDMDAKIMVQQQPMKMAAAEAVYDTSTRVPFSVLTIGTLDGSKPLVDIGIPGLTSFLATGDFNGKVEGINDLQAQYEQQYGPGYYKPNIPITFWSFRLMIGLGMLAVLFGLWAMWASRRGRVPANRWLLRAAIVLPLLPLGANSFGWIFTEMGRQPWVVFGLMQTSSGVSPNVPAWTVLTSLLVFTLLYGGLAVVEVGLMLRAIRQGPPSDVPADPYAVAADAERPLTFSY